MRNNTQAKTMNPLTYSGPSVTGLINLSIILLLSEHGITDDYKTKIRTVFTWNREGRVEKGRDKNKTWENFGE